MILWGESPTHQLYHGGPIVWTGGFAPHEATRGGVYRRALWSWLRAGARVRREWQRVYARDAWARVAYWTQEMSTTLVAHTFVKAASDSRVYGFDYSDAPEVYDGATVLDSLSSGTVSGGSGLTFGSVTTLASAFDDIPAGAGLKCQVSGGTAGTTYKFAMVGTTAAGRVLTIPCRMVVVADVPTS